MFKTIKKSNLNPEIIKIKLNVTAEVAVVVNKETRILLPASLFNSKKIINI
jgi:hypothetical protein